MCFGGGVVVFIGGEVNVWVGYCMGGVDSFVVV